MAMESIYFLSFPGGKIRMEISQDELRSLLGEIEGKLHRSKAYRNALTSLQKLQEPSSEQASLLLKAVGREAIGAVFEKFLQKHQQVLENNQQPDTNSKTSTLEQVDSTDLSDCLTSVKVSQKSPPPTPPQGDSSSHTNSVKLQKNTSTTTTSMKWSRGWNKKSKLAEQAKLIKTEQRVETLGQIGQQLRQARESQGLSLTELKTYTHIQISYMEALENGNLESLPEDVFVRGYIRVMGNALGLNGTALAASLPAPESVKSILPSHYKPEKISGLGWGINPIYLYAGYTALMAGAVGGLSIIVQQGNGDRLIHSEAVTPSSSSYNQSVQNKKPTTKPGLKSSHAGITVGRDISWPETL